MPKAPWAKFAATHARSGWRVLALTPVLAKRAQTTSRSLVKAGEGVEKRGKKRIDKELDAANNQIDEAAEEVSRVRGKVEIQLDKIEKAFDARVGRALNRLGIPSKHDVEALSIKLEQLHELLERVAHKP